MDNARQIKEGLYLCSYKVRKVRPWVQWDAINIARLAHDTKLLDRIRLSAIQELIQRN
jgi:hypothetical protein